MRMELLSVAGVLEPEVAEVLEGAAELAEELAEAVQEMPQFSFNLAETVGLSILVLLFGQFLVRKIGFLNKFCIPAPVVGGLIYAIVNVFIYMAGVEIVLDTTLQTFFMICFFTTVGFGASFEVLKKGGIGILIFLVLASLLCVIQNVAGIGVALAMGENPLLGIAVGSVPMTGGHATSAAFGEYLEQSGLHNAPTITVVAATFGLVSGSLMGGPVGARLIRKFGLKSSGSDSNVSMDLLKEESVPLNATHLCTAFFQVGIAVGIGSYISKGIAMLGVTLPAYIGGMLIAIVMRNVFTEKTVWNTRIKEIQALGEIFLAVFLAQALMNMKLWELASMALPLIVILAVQIIIMFLYATYVTFNVMGRDYDAAVLSAGHCGFGMGATPNGYANMSAVVSRFGPSTKAFFILPIVGGMFIDITNGLIINGSIEVVKALFNLTPVA